MSFLLKKVQQNLKTSLKKTENLNFLLAVSGGIDSMVLADVFAQLKLSFHVAHANFQLRGVESEQDETFVHEQSKKYLSDTQKIHIRQFHTLEELSKKSDTSIQMIARELRYQWFYELLKTHNLDYIVTAHHADDNIETFFLKLFRKSSQGLAGMNMLSEKQIFRPFLNIFRNEIEEYAQKNNILYREDSSNSKDDYLRNHIRHHLIPFIEKEYPTAKNAILDTMQYQKQLNLLADVYVQDIWQKTAAFYFDCCVIDLNVLQQYPASVQSVLPWHFAERLHIGMNQFEQFKYLFEPQTKTGKQMLTKTCKAVRYKQTIQVFKPNNDNKEIYLAKNNIDVLCTIPQEYILIHSDIALEPNLAEISYIRRWQHGDKILHKNKKTLIADLIPEYKITPYQKEYLYAGIENNKLDIAFVFFCPNSVLLQLR